MAHSLKSSNLSLTLPITCQICLGKVKQPVICPNNHVFCSSCMETWLKKTSVCPSCRVPITAENPCKEIIGGTNESKSSDDPSLRNNLRKTRGELLLQEYEAEVDDLMSENELLRTENQSLDAQLKMAVSSCSNSPVQQENSLPASDLQDLWDNVNAASDACAKFKEDVDTLTETNRVLRSQNADLVQEIMRLKEKLRNRSPQKYNCFTVATLESRIEEYERDKSRMKKALERNEQHIKELEIRLRKFQKACPEAKEAGGKSKAVSEGLTQQQKINMMMRSLSDNERELICSNPEAECSSFSRNVSLSSRPSSDRPEFMVNVAEDQRTADSNSPKCDFLPTTPSTAFQTLTLKSPGFPEKKVAAKSLSHQRKLDFNVSPEKEPRVVNITIPYMYSPTFGKAPLSDFMELSKSSFWSSLQKPDFNLPSPGPCHQSSPKRSTSSDVKEEATMNAFYQDKVSELDSMILEEGSSACRSFLSATSSHGAAVLESPPTPYPYPYPYPTAVWEPLKQIRPKKSPEGEDPDAEEAPEHSAEESFAADESGKEDGAVVADSSDQTGTSRFKMTFLDLPFDFVDEVEAGPSGSRCAADQDHPTSSSSSCTADEAANAEEKEEMSSGQIAKRKSQSPFSTHSPSKHSKLM